MNRRARAILAAVLGAGALLIAAACGEGGKPIDDRGAQLFNDRCAGCHTLSAAGSRGTVSGERPTGPNLDKRNESEEAVLYAIRNGGFSGAIMPQNIVVGEEAEAVAKFVARYAGSDTKGPASPRATASGEGGSDAGGSGSSGSK